MNIFRNAAAPLSPPKICSQRGGVPLIVVGVLATVCAVTTAAIWIMHLTATSAGVPEYSKAVTATRTFDVPQDSDSRNALSRLLSAPASAPTTGGREIEGVKLQGIVSDKRGTGVALFSVDGAPSVRVRAGGRVRDGLTLVEIQRRHVLLEQGGKKFELVLATRAMPQTGLANTPQRSIYTAPAQPAIGSGPTGNVAPGATGLPPAAPASR